MSLETKLNDYRKKKEKKINKIVMAVRTAGKNLESARKDLPRFEVSGFGPVKKEKKRFFSRRV